MPPAIWVAANPPRARSSRVLRSCCQPTPWKGKLTLLGPWLNRSAVDSFLRIDPLYRRRHEGRELLALRRSHGQAELRAPPEDIVRKARPFFCHEIAHFRFRQVWPEALAEIGLRSGLAEHLMKPRAVGRNQAQRLIRGQKPPALARGFDLRIESLGLKFATGQRRLGAPARRHRIERQEIRDGALGAQPRGCDVTAEHGQKRY